MRQRVIEDAMLALCHHLTSMVAHPQSLPGTGPWIDCWLNNACTLKRAMLPPTVCRSRQKKPVGLGPKTPGNPLRRLLTGRF